MSSRPRKKIWIPIRIKIAVLVAIALAASLSSYLYLGTTLLIRDKASYIYDQNQTKIQSASNAIEHQVSTAISLSRMMATLYRNSASGRTAMMESKFREILKPAGVSALLILSPGRQDHFEYPLSLGESTEKLKEAQTRFEWSPLLLKKEHILIKAPEPGYLFVDAEAPDESGKPLYIAFAIPLQSSIFGSAPEFHLLLLEKPGDLAFGDDAFLAKPSPPDFSRLLDGTVRSHFDSGVVEWKSGDAEYIVGYQHVLFQRFCMLSVVSKSVAFLAARQLKVRSLTLGISILLAAIGAALLTARKMTSRLRGIWLATQHVQKGDFDVRVASDGLFNDEIGGLIASFNSMASKIQDLIREVVKKARIETEIETAQAVQRHFFPTQQFEHPSFQVAGMSIPASECGGDWWRYAQIGNYLIVAIGDVTGHGVSAALLTAAAHGAFAILIEDLKGAPDSTPSIIALTQKLNTAILQSSRGVSNMTLSASILDLRTHELTLINASHRNPFLYRPPRDGSETAAKNPISPILTPPAAALGTVEHLNLTTTQIQLQPGDVILWYTDGLLECPNPQGNPMRKPHLLNMLCRTYEENGFNPHLICQNVAAQMVEFLGGPQVSASDDITVVVGVVPSPAKTAEAGLTLSEAVH